jgi:hypothetical protein
MAEHFVTLFDSHYLLHGLALHRSMQRHVKAYTLWVLCVDDKVFEVLTDLKLPNVHLLQLSKLETVDLLRVKAARSTAEYCWTLTPFAPRFVFEAQTKVDRVTYLDADLWFLKHPQPIFDELNASNKTVLITEHAYAPLYDQSAKSGKYCVQFLTFTRHGGEVVRKWWEERCIEWCYARIENGKFGDQKYLDDWPERFGQSVHVLQNKKHALAPWNATRFSQTQAIFYHFHGLRILSSNQLEPGSYALPKQLIESLYIPYSVDLRDALKDLEACNHCFKWQLSSIKVKNDLNHRAHQIYSVLGLSDPRAQIEW